MTCISIFLHINLYSFQYHIITYIHHHSLTDLRILADTNKTQGVCTMIFIYFKQMHLFSYYIIATKKESMEISKTSHFGLKMHRIAHINQSTWFSTSNFAYLNGDTFNIYINLLPYYKINISQQRSNEGCYPNRRGYLFGHLAPPQSIFALIQDSYFVDNNQISLAICMPSIIQPTVHKCQVVELDWFEEDQNKFSYKILRKKCQDVLIMINELKQKYENAIICDFAISSSAVSVCCIFLMIKYSWSLLKTLQYMTHKIPDLNIQTKFAQRLLQYDKKINQSLLTKPSILWQQDNQISEQALLVRNTYVNSRISQSSGKKQKNSQERMSNSKKKVKFVQQGQSKYIDEKIQIEQPTKFSLKERSKLRIQVDVQPQKSRIKNDVLLMRRTRSLSHQFNSFQIEQKPNHETEKKKTKPATHRSQRLLNSMHETELKRIEEEKTVNMQIINKIEEKVKQRFQVRTIRVHAPRYNKLKLNKSKLTQQGWVIGQNLLSRKEKASQ